jgi:arylsulfatase A-like enzyme
VHTTTLSKLADEGIRYNAFHTTSICSPTRAALLSGRNHTRKQKGNKKGLRLTLVAVGDQHQDISYKP